ncbi:putative C3H1-type domain-containing protein [Seiridium unicorne]|uniref:C3H1-type domain-containing protein n=1 Tax=Seiridium unicorne TaxID=138068 RepID=A0ABR2VDB2_9PEZI
MDFSAVESITDFVPRYREYAASKDTTENFIKARISDLMIYAEHVENTARQESLTLSSQLRNAQFDYEDSVNSRRELQARIKDLESQLSFLTKDNTVLKHRNPYVLVLIDGNSLIFKDHLIKQGLEGGNKAAYALRQAVYAKVPDDTEIVAKVVANLGGLAKTLKRNENEVKEFMLGFTQASASFDFIDVAGAGAASKIEATARFNLRNYNCKQILIGVSDPGFARLFTQVIDDVKASRIVLLEGCPSASGREIAATGIDITNFDAIFRSDKVNASAATTASSLASTPASISATPFTYATITQKASPPPQLVLPLAPKTNTTKNTAVRVTTKAVPVSPPWNPGPRGLDPPIPLNQNVLDVVKKRTGSDKLCNNHYLRGPCSKGDSCCFEHNHTPTPDEIRAIQFLARLNPCTNGQDCDVDNCIYGHHCPSVKDGACVHPFCKFHPHEHPPGTKLKAKKAFD